MEQYLTPMGPTKLHVNPIFEISPLEPRFSEWLVFEGLSVDEQGRQHFLDASVAYKRAVLNCIHYLSKFGYTKQQVHCCSSAAASRFPCSIPTLNVCICVSMQCCAAAAGVSSSICVLTWMSHKLKTGSIALFLPFCNHHVWLRHVYPCQCCATACSLGALAS